MLCAARSPRGKVSLERLGRPLLVITLVEVFLGGNGYLTEVAGIRLRVLLYLVCMAWVAVRLVSDPSVRVHRAVWGLFFLFLATTSIGTLIGLLYGNSTSAIAAELKPLFYFPLILFYALAIRDMDDIALVSKLIVVCSLIQAVAFLALMLAVHTRVVPYSTVYLALRESDEFIFRHNPEDEFFLGFFYKGGFHLGVAALFLLTDPVQRNFKYAAITIAALGFTMTRSLIVALVMSLFLRLALIRRKRMALLLGFTGSLAVLAYIAHTYGLLIRPESDSVRIADFKVIGQNIDLSMSIFGRGMGAPIGERERIEMTFLEVFYKQGVVGLAPWLVIVALILAAFRNIRGALRPQATVFVLAAAYVYFATLTNPFLTGSIGMSVVLLSTVALLVMEDRDEYDAGKWQSSAQGVHGFGAQHA